MDLRRLTHFPGLIPGGLSCAFESATPSWLAGELTALLAERGFCLAGELAGTANGG